LTITLDNVVFDGMQPAFQGAHNGGPASPSAAHFKLGSDVSVSGTPGTAAPVDCSAAFVPLKSVAPTSPI
jgi:polygalacturonase